MDEEAGLRRPLRVVRKGSLRWAVVALFLVVGPGWMGRALTVSVVEFFLHAGAGERTEFAFTVLNDEPVFVRLVLSVSDWDDGEDGVTRIVPAGSVRRSCAAWLDVGPRTLDLPPYGEAEIHGALTVPPAVAGTYWAGVVIDVGSLESDAAANQLRVNRRFLIRIHDTALPATTAAKVERLVVGGLTPFGITVRLTNDGATMLVGVSGVVTVEDSGGALLLESLIPAFDVLPEHAVDVPLSFSWGLTRPGNYLVRAVFDFGATYLVAGQALVRVAELVLSPIGSASGPPIDRDGDGLYEDVDGNGVLDARDADLLEEELDSAGVRRNARAFDFDNDGRLSVSDVETLRRLVSLLP